MGAPELLRDCEQRLSARPGDPEVVAVLEVLLESEVALPAARLLAQAQEQAKNFEGLIHALEEVAKRSAQFDEKVNAFVKVSQVYRHSLSQPDLALAGLAKALALAPGVPALHRLAEEVALEADAVDVLMELLQDLLDEASTPAQVALRKTLASLSERVDVQGSAGLAHLRAALALAPNDVELLGALRRIHARREEWAALAEVTEKLASGPADLETRASLWREAARLHATRLYDEDSALTCWRQVLALAPHDDEARKATAALEKPEPPPDPTRELLKALAAFHTHADKPSLLPRLRELAVAADALEDLAEGVEAESEKVESSAEAAALLRFVATLREDLGDGPRATVLWNDLLALQPDNVEALEHLTTLLTAAGDAVHAAETMLRRARVMPSGAEPLQLFTEASDRLVSAGHFDAALRAIDEALSRPPSVKDLASLAPLHFRRGQLLERSADPRAVEAYAQALASHAHRAQALSGLERLLKLPAAKVAAARALEPELRPLQEPKRLAPVLEVLLDAATDDAERLRLVLQLAPLWEQAGQPRAATHAWLWAVRLQPADLGLRAQAERAAGATQAREELLTTYQAVLENHPTAADAGLLKRVAELLDAVGQPAEGLEMLERAVDASPADPALLQSLIEKSRARGDFARLAKALRKHIASTPPSAARAKLLHELANLCEDCLADPTGAAQAYQELLDESPKDPDLVKKLLRLYEQLQNVVGLVQVLEKSVALAKETGGTDVVALSLRLAKLKIDASLDDAGSLALLKDVLQRDAGNAQAVTAAARLASTPGPVQHEAAQLASVGLGKLGDHALVVKLLEAQLAGQNSAKGRAAILHQMAELQAGPLGEPELAFLSMVRSLRENPLDATILHRCLALSEAAQASDELTSLLEELAAAQPPGAGRALLYRTLAKQLDAQQAPDEALKAWSEVLAQVPGDTEATQRLEALYEAAGRFIELAALAQRRVDAAPVTGRPAALMALAHALERAGQLDEAASTLRSLFALTRGREALVQLEGLLARLGHHLERAEVLKRLAAEATDAQEKTARLLEEAKVLRVAQEPERAVSILADVLAHAPDEPRAVQELLALLSMPPVKERAGSLLETVFKGPAQRSQRVAILEALVQTPGMERARALRQELAALHESGGDVKQAFANRLRLTMQAPEDAAARAQLERVALAAHLEEELIAAYEDLLERPTDAALALSLKETIARLYAGPLGQPENAVKAWEDIAHLAPDSLEALAALVSLYRQSERFDDLYRVLMAQGARLARPETQGVAFREAAQIAGEKLGDLEKAVQAWREWLERDPQDLEAWHALATVLERQGQLAEAAEALATEVALAKSQGKTEQALTQTLHRAQLLVGDLRRFDDAFADYVEVLEARPMDASAVAGLELLLVRAEHLRPAVAELLERVYRQTGNTPRLCESLELQLPAAPPPRQLALLEELTTLREGTGELLLAFLARQEIYLRTPEDAHTRRELKRLAEIAGQQDELVALYRQRLTEQVPLAEALELWRILADTFLHQGQRTQAAQALEEVARAAPDDAGALTKLQDIYRAEQAHQALASVLERRVALEPQPAKQLQLWFELAVLAQTRLADDGAAIEACLKVLAIEAEHAGATALLEQLLESSGRFQELAEHLSARLSRAAPQSPLALELKVRLAQVSYRSLQQDDAAFTLLAEVLAAEPAHAQAIAATEALMRCARPVAEKAAQALERHYAQSSATQSAIAAFEVRIQWAQGEAVKPLYHHIADLYESPLGSPTDALWALSQCLSALPDDAPTLERIRTLAPTAHGEAQIVALLTELVPKAEHKQTKHAMLRLLGQWRETLGDRAGALAAWQELLTLSPDDVPALEAASGLAEKASRWDELDALLQRRLNLAPDTAAKLALFSRLADVRLSHLADVKGAHAALRSRLSLQPDDVATLRRVEAVCEQLGRWNEVAEMLGRRLRFEPEGRDELLLRLAQVRRNRLQDLEGALPPLSEILQAHSQHPGALAELSECVEAKPGWEPAEDVLLSAYRKNEDAARLGVLLDACAHRAANPTRKRALWLELSELRNKEKDSELAFLALARAYREAPQDLALRDRLVALAGPAESQEALGALLEEVLPALADEPRADTALVLAALCEGALKEPERAVELYREAMTLAPAFTDRALSSLDRVLQSLSRWQELREVLAAREHAAVELPEKIELLLRLAVVDDERLNRLAEAAQTYRAVLEHDDKHLGAAWALKSIYERTQDTEALKAILEHLVKLETLPKLEAAQLQLAQLNFNDAPARTEALCRALLENNPLHGEAFTLLASLFEAAKRLGDLELLLKARLQITLNPKDAGELAFRLADLHYRQLKAPDAGAQWYRLGLGHAPRNVNALLALAEIDEAQRNLRELKDVLATLAQVQEDVAARRGHHVRRAEVLAELGEREAAILAARSALDLSPQALEEARRLTMLLLTLGALSEAATALNLTGDLELAGGHLDQAVTTWLQLFEVEQKLSHVPKAAAALEKILEHQPTHRRAYDEAQALYTQAQNWAAWAKLTSAFVPHLTGGERLFTLDALVDVHEDKLHDAPGAFPFARAAVREDPGSKPRRDKLEKLGRALKHLPDVAALYDELLQALPFGAEYLQVALSLAALQDEHLNQVDAAEATLQRVLAFDPVNQPALDALEHVFTRRGLHQKRAEALELKVEAVGTPEGRAALLETLGGLYEDKLQDAKRAAQSLRRRLEAQPKVANAQALATFYRRQQDWPQVLSALLHARGLASTPTERAALQLDIAKLREGELSDVEAAVGDYQHALELDPTAGAPFRALERLYISLQRHAELLKTYERRLGHTADEAEKVELFFKCAALWKDKNDSAHVDRCYESVLALRPADEKALEALAAVRRADQRWTRLVDALARHAAVSTKPSEQAALCTELGDVCLHKLHDKAAARGWWTKALAAVPAHRPALKGLSELNQAEGRWADAVQSLRGEAELETEPAARTELYFQIGALSEERLNDATAAAAAWKQALSTNPVHLPSLRRLRTIYLKAAQWPDYQANLTVEAERATRPEDQCAAALELAQHYLSRVRDGSAATKWYQHAFAVRPSSLDAALPLSSLLYEAKDWAQAVRVLETTVNLLERAGAQHHRELSNALRQWAFAQRQLKAPDAALAAYARALQVDPADAVALEGTLEVLEQMGRTAEAAAKLDPFLAQHARTLDVAARGELYVHLGQLYLNLGQADRAVQAGERVLEGNPVHVEALRLLVAASDQVAAYDKAATYRQRLAALAPEEERYGLHFEAAVLALDKLANPARAIDGLLNALKAKPNAKQALQRLAAAYRAAGHNRKAAETMQSVLALPDLGAAEWRTETLALADLLGRAMNDSDRAVDVLEAALDKDATFIEALQVIEALWGKKKEWEHLDACYLRMIRRLGDKPDTAMARAALYRSIAELRLRRLKNRESALEALEASARLLPDDATAQEAFADLAVDFPARAADALAAYRRALPTTSDLPKVCRAVAAVAERARDFDTHFLATRAALVTNTLADVAPLEPPPFKGHLAEPSWRTHLLHPDVTAVGELMELLYEQAGRAYATDLGDLRLHPQKHLVNLHQILHPHVELFLRLAQGLGFARLPILYSPYWAGQSSHKRVSHHDDNASLRVLPTFPVTFLVGERFFNEPNPGLLHALMGRGLAYLRPELALAAILTFEQLKLLFEAALSLGDESYHSRADAKALKNEKKRLEKALSPNARVGLASVVTATRPKLKRDSLSRYLAGASHTALRTALLLAGDFASVRTRLIPRGGEGEPMVRALLDFGLGGGLHAVRVETGTAVTNR